jgi:hypothetical protein
VLGVTQRVVLGSRLGEPDITTVSTEVTALESLGDILLHDDGTTGGVDEPGARLHLGNQFLVEQTLGLLVKRAVDGHDITLRHQLLEGVNPAGANLLLDLRLEWLVVVVEELLAVEGLETAQNTLTDTANGNGTDNLVLEVKLVLGDGGNIPVTVTDLVVGRDEVADKGQDGHDNVLSNGDDVGAGNFGNGDTAIGLVGGVEVDVVGTDTSGDGDLEVLGLGQTLGSQVSRVEAVKGSR